MDELQKLYDVLYSEGYYTKSFEEFQNQWGDEQYQTKVYDVVYQDGLYTKDRDSFNQKYVGQPKQQYNKFDYKAAPEQVAPTAERQLMSGLESKIPGFEQEMVQREAKKKAVLQSDLSAKQRAVESTAQQQEDASLLAYQSARETEVLSPLLKNEFLKGVYQQLKDEETLPSFVKDQLSTITPEFIFLGEGSLKKQSLGVEQLGVEEAVVPKMNYMFGPLGFKFEESGMTGDYMMVKAPNGEEIEISLNNRSMEKNRLESEKLKNFIAAKSAKIPQIEKYAAQYAGSDARFNSEKQIDTQTKDIAIQYDKLNKDAALLSNDIKNVESDLAYLNSAPANERNTSQYLEKKKATEAALLDVNTRRQEIISRNSQIESNKTNLDRAVGKYSAMKAEQGTWTGATVSFIGEGISTAVSGIVGFAVDVKTLGGKLPRTIPYTEEMYKKDKKEGLSAIREGIQGAITDPNTTVEWKQLAEEGFWGGAYAGLIKSAPAMLAPGGWAGRTAAFFGQSNDAVNQEMDKNPAFDNVSAAEKLLITVPIGIANAVLEEVGLSNMIKNKGFVNSLVLKGLQKAGLNATETTLSKIIKNDVESMVARGALTLAGAGLAEAETGAGQQIAEYAVKDIYNLAKEKEMFDTPDTLKEYVYDVVRSGAQEAVGGFVMGTPSAAAAAYRKQGFKGMTDEQFETFEAIANDEKMQSSFVATLKTKVAAGDMTMAEAKEELNDYRNSVGLYRSIPTDLSTEAKKEAMNLVREKQVIEERIKDKDEALVKKQKDRIAEINVQLNTLSENAVQKQTTSEVPIQSETGVSEEVEGGKPKAEPQVTTEEGKEEEVVTPDVTIAEAPVIETAVAEEAPVAEVTTAEEVTTPVTEAPAAEVIPEEVKTAEVATAEGDIERTTKSFEEAGADIAAIDADQELDAAFESYNELLKTDDGTLKGPAKAKLTKAERKFRNLAEAKGVKDFELIAYKRAKKVLAAQPTIAPVIAAAPAVEVAPMAPSVEVTPTPAPAVEVVAPTPMVEAAPAKTAKIDKQWDEEMQSVSMEIDYSQDKIEQIKEEIEIEKGNTKDGIAEIKEKMAKVRESVTNKETRKNLLEELETELEDFKEGQADLIQSYKDDIAQQKADAKKAQKRLDKLTAKREQATQPAAAPKKRTEILRGELDKRYPLVVEFFKSMGYDLSRITSENSLDILAAAYQGLSRSKVGAEKLLLQITEIENLVEELDQDVKKVSKDEFKKQIAESGDFNKKQLKIFNALIDSLQTELMPEYMSDEQAKKLKGGDNFYVNSLNQIISKDPQAFIHEVGHFGFYKVLSKEDRLNYYRYMIDSNYGKSKPSLASRMAISSDELVGITPAGQKNYVTSNATDNFAEYFAVQFEQWYMGERIFPKDIDAIFDKVAKFFNLLIEKLKSGKYVDQNLSEYFNKISAKIEKDQKKNQKIQEVLGIEETMMDELQDLEDFFGIDPEISPMSMRYDTPLQKMALMYNMTETGFFPRNASEPHINKDFFQFGLKAKRASSGSYYLVNINTGKMVKPLQRPKGGLPPQTSRMKVTPISVKNMSMDEVVVTARENGFSDDVIKALLMKRGYAAKDIDSALTFNINFASAYTNNNPRTDSPLPRAFRTIDGGVNAGIKLFFDVRNKLIDFAATKKTYAEIRAKAVELLEANTIFQGQEDTKQLELIAAFDKTLNITRGKLVSAQIADIRKAIKERLEGVKDLKKAQLILRNFIRQSLPAVKVPRVFFNLDGITSPAEGINYYNSLRKQVYDFARTAPDGTVGKKILVKDAEKIKEFTINLLKGTEVYKNQSPEVQADMENAIVNSQYTKGTSHTLDIYSQKEVNKLIDIVSQTDAKNLLAQAEKVFDIITEQRAKIKNGLLKEMLILVNKKAATNKTGSGKVRSRGLDAQGQAFYKSIKPIVAAAIKNDTDAMLKIADELSDVEAIQDALDKESAGEDLTTLERALLDKVYAFDTFGDILNMELEEVQDLLDGLKGVRSASIIRLNEKRADRAAQREAMTAAADEQISTDFKALYNPDGSPKGKNKLDSDKAMIWLSFKEGKIWSALTQWLNRYDFIRSPLTDYFRKTLAHLGTISNILDKSGTFFADNVYRPLNRMDEVNKTNYINETKNLDDIANSIKGVTKGYKQIRRLIESVGVVKMNIIGQGIDPRNGDQLARIYALSLNEVQREKLRNMGYTDQKIEEIKKLLGPEVTEFADKLVEYFSNEYYESVNDVYSFVNDVNLGYVENYFPTQTISQSKDEKNDAIKRLEDANFSGTFDAESSPAFKERTDLSNPIDLAPSFTNVVESHLQSMERYKAYAVGVKRLNDLFKIQSVNTLLEQTGLKRIMKNLVNMSINPNAGINQEKTDISRVFNKFSGFALAFKLAQIPKQATAIVAAYEDYQFLKGRKVPALDTVMFMFDVAKALTLTRSNFNKFYNLSGNFRDRINKGVEGDVYGLESGGKVFKPLSQKANTLGDVKRFIKSAAASPTMVGDIISVYGYMANYNRDIANGMSPEAALEKFNNYNATLQSRRAADKGTLQFSQNELVRAFTMFGSTGILQMNKVAMSYKNIMRAIANKNMPAGKDLRALAINLGIANAMFVAASYAFALIKGDDEDKEKVEKKMFDALVGLNLFYQLPLIGASTEELVNAIKGEKTMGGDVTNPYSSVFRKIKKYYDEENTIIENFRPAAELALGMQLDPFIGLYKGATEEFDDEVIYDILGISPSYRPQNASSLEKMSKSELKKYNPDEYKRLYGPGSKGYDAEQAEKEEKAAKKKARKDAMDDYYNYESGSGPKRGGSRIKSRGSRTSGSRIK